jgi:hypothetical protein
LEEKIQTFENQIASLQEKVIHLETLLKNSKYPLSDPSHPSESSKTIQQDSSTLKSNMGSYLQENDPQINSNLQQAEETKSKSLSEDKIRPVTPLSQSQQ